MLTLGFASGSSLGQPGAGVTKSSLLPVFVNKAVLEHSSSHAVVHCLWLLVHYN